MRVAATVLVSVVYYTFFLPSSIDAASPMQSHAPSSFFDLDT
eukprot:COSAG01_NODE_32762_length_575_cov_9.308824_1_plen_41_part_10